MACMTATPLPGGVALPILGARKPTRWRLSTAPRDPDSGAPTPDTGARPHRRRCPGTGGGAARSGTPYCRDPLGRAGRPAPHLPRAAGRPRTPVPGGAGEFAGEVLEEQAASVGPRAGEVKLKLQGLPRPRPTSCSSSLSKTDATGIHQTELDRVSRPRNVGQVPGPQHRRSAPPSPLLESQHSGMRAAGTRSLTGEVGRNVDDQLDASCLREPSDGDRPRPDAAHPPVHVAQNPSRRTGGSGGRSPPAYGTG
jgi:hypothetical protein